MWSSSKRSSQPAVEVKQDKYPFGLLEQFQESAYGTYCQTLAYNKSEGDPLSHYTVWQKAIYEPDGAPNRKWSVYEVKETNYQFKDLERDIETPNHTIKQITTGLSYFDAIKALALFESAPLLDPEDNYEIVGPSPDELGTLYYKTLANRDGIIFDLQNDPHPTRNGEIVTEGRFADEDIDAFKAAIANNNEDLSPDIPGMFQKILEASQKAPLIKPSAIIEMHRKKDKIKECLNLTKIYASFLKINIEAEFSFSKINFNKLQRMAGVSKTIKSEDEEHYSYSRSYNQKKDKKYDRKFSLILSAPSLEQKYKLYTKEKLSKPSLTQFSTAEAEKEYPKAQKVILKDLYKKSLDAINTIEDEELSEKLQSYVTELNMIHQLYFAKLAIKQAKEHSLSGENPKDIFHKFETIFNEIAEDIRSLSKGLSEKKVDTIIDGFKNSIMHSQEFNPEIIPWEKYDAAFKAMEQDISNFSDMITDEWNGKEAHKKLPITQDETKTSQKKNPKLRM